MAEYNKNLCTNCCHLPVCVHKDTYSQFQEAVNKLTICEECKNGETRIISIRQFD